ncbi:hypothetical protein AVEN_33910-1 [Araneus ventricosus]|uniref:Uncharacterized protein n=1 Tax=Araneus ventricosus TaxID=182803 RepID=A0A4Y2EJZ4_ARAVE|nr:hypothetical protein AVEN_33910-1 [Araneus ventricosus]
MLNFSCVNLFHVKFQSCSCHEGGNFGLKLGPLLPSWFQYRPAGYLCTQDGDVTLRYRKQLNLKSKVISKSFMTKVTYCTFPCQYWPAGYLCTLIRRCGHFDITFTLILELDVSASDLRLKVVGDTELFPGFTGSDYSAPKQGDVTL